MLEAPRRALLLILGISVFLLPLLLALLWGPYFADPVFGRLVAARSLTGSAPAAPAGIPYTAYAPLFIALLAAAGGYATPAAMLLSALGWGVTALAVLITLSQLGRVWAGVGASLLIAVNPIILTTAGAEYSWVLAAAWTALALSAGLLGQGSRPATVVWVKSLLLVFLLGMQLDAGTVLFALALLALDVYEGRAGWGPFFFVAARALVAGLVLPVFLGPALTADPAFWWQQTRAFFGRWQLAWLFLPFILAGLYESWTGETIGQKTDVLQKSRQVIGLAVLWSAVSLVAQSPVTPANTSVLALVLTGIGVTWLGFRILSANRLNIQLRWAPTAVILVLFLPLLLVDLVALGQRYLARPVLPAVLETQAAAWLAENADPGATLYALQHVGYWANRATAPAQIAHTTDATVGDIYARLFALKPDYIVTEQSLPWDYITGTTWFKERYAARAHFANAYAPDAPVTVWEYVPSPFDEGTSQTLEATISEQLALIKYQFSPQIIGPGEDVYLTLDLQALEPVSTGFFTVAHLVSPDGQIWSWRDQQTPHSVPGAWWQPGLAIPERVQLQTTADLLPGAYDLQVFWRASDNKTLWPVYREGVETPFDRVHLGYVVVPPPADPSGANVVGARFADEILLEAAKIAPSLAAAPGDTLDVTLYWNALKQPTADYTVFLHLSDEEGELVAAHDGMPVNDRLPTQAFPPGTLIADTHRLVLPDDLTPGVYQLKTGMYLLESGERLPVWDAGGLEQADRALPLGTIDVGR